MAGGQVAEAITRAVSPWFTVTADPAVPGLICLARGGWMWMVTVGQPARSR